MIDKYIDKIINQDCLDALNSIPDNSVDITFADPPFNLSKSYNSYRDSKDKEEYLKWSNQWIEEMVRVTKPSGSIFLHNIPKWLTYYSELLNQKAHFRHWITWDSGGAPMGKTLLPNHYGILYYTKSSSYKDFKFYDIRKMHPRCRVCKEHLKDYGGKKHLAHLFGPLLSDVWSDIHRIKHAKRRNEHPCQLPVPLLERIILMSTDVDDIVLDPFIGTGTTAVAAKRLGRKYVGIELDSTYAEVARKNIKETRVSKIEEIFVSIYLDKIKTIRDIDFKQLVNGSKVSADSQINHKIYPLLKIDRLASDNHKSDFNAHIHFERAANQ